MSDELDLNALREIASAATGAPGSRYYDEFEPETVLALIARAEDAERALDAAERQIQARSGETAGERIWRARAEAAEKIVAEWSQLATRLGYGDGVTEPQATPAEVADQFADDQQQAMEHAECAIICELCGEPLASTTCEHCHGAGGFYSDAYIPCDWCGGAGKIHEGCAEESYGDLATRAKTAEAKVAQAEALLADWENREAAAAEFTMTVFERGAASSHRIRACELRRALEGPSRG